MVAGMMSQCLPRLASVPGATRYTSTPLETLFQGVCGMAMAARYTRDLSCVLERPQRCQHLTFPCLVLECTSTHGTCTLTRDLLRTLHQEDGCKRRQG